VFAWILTLPAKKTPTLDSILYGANVSDILTRLTHPILDIVAWFTVSFSVAAFIWLFLPNKGYISEHGRLGI
jgi:hypothetical protein